MIVELLPPRLNNQAMIDKRASTGLTTLTHEQRALAANFTQAMAEKGAPTPGDIASRCDVSEQAVSNWKRTGKITKKNLAIVSEMTGWSISKLLTGKDGPGPRGSRKSREISESDWQTLQHINVLPHDEQVAERERLAKRAKVFEEYAAEILKRAKEEK